MADGASGIDPGWPGTSTARRAAGGSEALMDEIASAVHAYILREFLPGEDSCALTEQTPLITGGILDSITTLKLVNFLETRFGVLVEAHETGVDCLDTIGQIARLIGRKTGMNRRSA
jgi:acyl carrier protein